MLPKITSALTIGTIILSGAAHAKDIGDDVTFGLGLGGGTLSNGLTAKYYLGEDDAVQAVFGFSGWGFSLGADYVHEFAPLYKHPRGELFWGVGGGAGAVFYDVGIDSATVFGLSAVIELGWHFKSIPLEIVTDWRPTYFVGDYIGGFYFAGGGGAIRWFF
jgi:hypothetical protein